MTNLTGLVFLWSLVMLVSSVSEKYKLRGKPCVNVLCCGQCWDSDWEPHVVSVRVVRTVV